jgi:hypothetical protein
MLLTGVKFGSNVGANSPLSCSFVLMRRLTIRLGSVEWCLESYFMEYLFQSINCSRWGAKRCCLSDLFAMCVESGLGQSLRSRRLPFFKDTNFRGLQTLPREADAQTNQCTSYVKNAASALPKQPQYVQLLPSAVGVAV